MAPELDWFQKMAPSGSDWHLLQEGAKRHRVIAGSNWHRVRGQILDKRLAPFLVPHGTIFFYSVCEAINSLSAWSFPGVNWTAESVEIQNTACLMKNYLTQHDELIHDTSFRTKPRSPQHGGVNSVLWFHTQARTRKTRPHSETWRFIKVNLIKHKSDRYEVEICNPEIMKLPFSTGCRLTDMKEGSCDYSKRLIMKDWGEL